MNSCLRNKTKLKQTKVVESVSFLARPESEHQAPTDLLKQSLGRSLFY